VRTKNFFCVFMRGEGKKKRKSRGIRRPPTRAGPPKAVSTDRAVSRRGGLENVSGRSCLIDISVLNEGEKGEKECNFV